MRIALIPFFGLSALAAAASGPNYDGHVLRLDPALDALIATDARPELLASGFNGTESPAWRKTGGYVLFTEDQANTIWKWKEGEGVSVFLRPSGYTESDPPPFDDGLGSNGMVWDRRDRLVIADQGNRRVVRLQESNWTKVVLADRYHDKRLNSPNDLVFRSNGDLYFTDPPYGLAGENKNPQKELNFNGVFRLTADGELQLIISDLTFPNGIALSPDEKTLYICVSDEENPRVVAYDLKPDGTVENGRIFFDARELFEKAGRRGAPDGMKIDRKGNIFLGGPGGILIITPQGKHLGTIVTGTVCANCGWGDDGSTLYIAAGSKFMRIRTKTVGEGF